MKQSLERRNEMKKDKGFTLIELLAVIVILAIIALIAVPTVMNIINKANKSAFKNSAYGLIKAGELFYTDQLLTNAGLYEDKTFTFPDDTEGLEIKGSKPTGGYVTVNKEGQVSMAVTNGKYCVTKDFEDEDVTITDGNCEVEDDSGDVLDNKLPIEWNTKDVLNNTSVVSGEMMLVRVSSLIPNVSELRNSKPYVVYNGMTMTFSYVGSESFDGLTVASYIMDGDSNTNFYGYFVSKPGEYNGLTFDRPGVYVMNFGHENMGGLDAEGVFDIVSNVVYYNPNEAKVCTKTEWENNNDKNGKSGCMRWYRYGEEGNQQKLMLDHNTTDKINWLSDDDYSISSNGEVPVTLIRQLEEDTDDWKVKADIVDAVDLLKLIPYFQKYENKIDNWCANDCEYVFAYVGAIGEAMENIPRSNYNSDREYTDAVIDYVEKQQSELVLPRELYWNYEIVIVYDENWENIDTSEIIPTHGYWTKTKDGSNAFMVSGLGIVGRGGVDDDLNGVRPVIKISK